MLIVADTSPISYLILIREIAILPKLYGRVIIPPKVLEELKSDAGPESVRIWAAGPPSWLEIRSPASVDPTLPLHEGERAAIALAKELQADQLLIDDRKGREVALRIGIPIAGTLAVLLAGGITKLLDFESALERLKQTNFRASRQLFQEFLEEYRRNQPTPSEG